MTRNEIIEKTLKDMRRGPLDPEAEAIDKAELQCRLPDTEIKTCEDFKHLNVECCETCHRYYPVYEMKLIDLPDGTKAWVCDPVEWAIYPERRQQLQEWSRNSAEGKMLRSIFGDGDPDGSSSE